ncbi:AprI/Inh family metalloprotease inhibitor [Devosia sp. ZB163]|uniref:AprI/Inh family metalloprotease inhibitor n=1 Tax=Devosia sp. ZB163 TaxID=3025938 RepID=UPI00235EED14|nr:AprI/Inh family metalloprotease inhibitor [Devosia sp. ZB163]MDC9822144.1 AprI/Inh family metalloprotease inhibitor [Devosia sp. ZB163]
MMMSKRAGFSVAMVTGAALLLSGCASSGVTTSSIASTETITPIQNTPVASSDLNALPGTQVQPASLGQPAPLVPGQPQAPGTIGTPVHAASADSLSLGGGVGAPTMPGRDLSTGLSVEKLLGGWTVVSGQDQCKLNLTQTAKSGTSRYRASTPGCALTGLNVVASWQLVGNQVQLFDENGDIVASLILSAGQFIGTLAGGQGISMVG